MSDDRDHEGGQPPDSAIVSSDPPPEARREGKPNRRHPNVALVAASESFVGPLPPPSMLAQYDQLSPGLAERIVKMAENEQQHRHEQERDFHRRFFGWQHRGQWFGFGTAVALLGTAWAALAKGYPWVAGTAIAAVATALTIFVLQERDKPDVEEEQEDPE